jgi:predicted dienelactone hydrolase
MFSNNPAEKVSRQLRPRDAQTTEPSLVVSEKCTFQTLPCRSFSRGLMRYMLKPLLFCLMFAMVVSTASAARLFHVGVTDRAFLKGDVQYDWRGAKTHALLTTIWYPADPSTKEIEQWVGEAEHPFASEGKAGRDAKIAIRPAKFPLILLSHGTGGSALMMAWLATVLAAHGYIAAAVNHPGDNTLEPYTIQGFTLGWERAVDLSKVLDGLLADPEFGSHIDAKRVGAAGFSLGGYTVVELAGGIGKIDVEAIQARCGSTHPTDALCASPLEFPDLVPKAIQLSDTDPHYVAALNKSDESHRDPRVRAVFAMAPAVAEWFSPESLSRISIPIEIVAGASDPVAPPAINARYLAAHIPHARLTIYPGGVAHYTFLDTCTEGGKKQSPDFCVDRPGVNRDAIHAQAALQGVSFFDKHLAH